MKNNRMILGCVWALSLGLAFVRGGANHRARMRYEAQGDPVVVGDAESSAAFVATSDVGNFRRKPISPGPATQVVSVTPARTASYRRQEGDPRPMPQAAPRPLPRRAMPEQGSSPEYAPGQSPGHAPGQAPIGENAWHDACGCNDGCGGGHGRGCGGGCDWWSVVGEETG